MKLKILFPMLFICLLATVSSAQVNAQEKDFDVSISIKDQAFLQNSGAWLVRVKITNFSDKVLNTKDCGLIFRFRKTAPESKSADALGDYALQERSIKQNETFEFEANLKNLRWIESAKPSVFVLERKDRFAYKPALSGNYSLTATVNKNEEAGSDKDAVRRMRVVSITSKALAVKVASKTDK
ncbi:MAG TPA: hypothetical protein VF599_03380 [Pyrinomonadaceae bacterium]|jgi:hypothetical protein